MSLHLLLDLVNSIHNLETVFETHISEYLFNIVSFLHLASRPKLLLYKQTPDPIFLCPWITSKHCFNLTKEMTAHAGCFLARTRDMSFMSVYFFSSDLLLSYAAPTDFITWAPLPTGFHWVWAVDGPGSGFLDERRERWRCSLICSLLL